MLSLSTQIVLGMCLSLCLNAVIASVWLCLAQPYFSIFFFVFMSVYSIFEIRKFMREFSFLKFARVLDTDFAKLLYVYHNALSAHPQFLVRFREFIQAVLNDYSGLKYDLRTWAEHAPLASAALNRFVEDQDTQQGQDVHNIVLVRERVPKVEDVEPQEPQEDAEQVEIEDSEQIEIIRIESN